MYWHGPALQSYDATTHFESTVDDVLNMYTLITGKVRIKPPQPKSYWSRLSSSLSTVHFFTKTWMTVYLLILQVLDLNVDLSAASAAEEWEDGVFARSCT